MPMPNNPIMQMLMNRLQTANPQGYQTINNLMQSNGNPQELLHQMMGNATPEQREGLLKQAKEMGAPENILSQIQNMK